MFFRILSVSIGVVKSERISQLTGSTVYFSAEAISRTVSKVGSIVMKCTSGLRRGSSFEMTIPDVLSDEISLIIRRDAQDGI